MAFVPTLAGKLVESATLDVPARGRWIARVVVAEETTLAGQVDLTLVEGDTWRGTVISGQGYAGRTKLIVIGGRNGLPNWVPAKSYLGSPLSAVVGDTLSSVGETLLDESGGILSRVNASYVRMAGSAIHTLEQVCEAIGTSWQTTKDLQVRIGPVEQTAVTWSYEVTDRNEDLAKIEIASETGLAVPGNVIADLLVVRASHQFSASKVRSILWGAF